MAVATEWAELDENRHQSDDWMEGNTAVVLLRQSAFFSSAKQDELCATKFGLNLSRLETARKYFVLSFGGALKKEKLLSTYNIVQIDSDEDVVIPWEDDGPAKCLRLPQPSRRQFLSLVSEELRKVVKMEGKEEEVFVDSVEDLAAKDFQRGSVDEHQEFWGSGIGFKELPAWTRLETEKQRALRLEVLQEVRGVVLGLFCKDHLPQYSDNWGYCVAWALRAEAATQKAQKGSFLGAAAVGAGGLRIVAIQNAQASPRNFNLDEAMEQLGVDGLPEMSPLSPNTISLALQPSVLEVLPAGSPVASAQPRKG
jgi:hypothetical protein